MSTPLLRAGRGPRPGNCWWLPPASCWRLLGCLLPAGLLLSACSALGPEFSPPSAETPAHWSDGQSGDVSVASLPIAAAPAAGVPWWREFDDPLLEQLQQQAQQANPDLQSALLAFAQARLQQQLVSGSVEVSASGAASRQRLSESGASMRMAAISAPANKDALISALAQPFSLYQAGFDASWEPDFWGRVSRSIEAAAATSDASAALLQQTRLGLSAELARSYFQLRGVQRQIALLRQQIALAEQQRRLLEANRAAGLIDSLPARQQQIQLDELRAALPPLQSQIRALENGLALMLGELPGTLSAQLADATDSAVAEERLTPLLLGLPAELARRRPDIQAAEAQLHAATAQIGIATADLYPRVTLRAGLGIESFEQGTLDEWGSRNWSIGPGFYLPIFNQGRLRTRVALTELAQQQAAVHFQQTVLHAWQEIDTGLNLYAGEWQRYRQLQQKRELAQQQQQLNAAQYAAGLRDASAELQAAQALLGIERQLAESASTLKVQRVAIYKAAGGAVGEGERAL